MKAHFTSRRVIAAVLTAVLLLSLIPSTTMATAGATITGAPVTVELGADRYTDRENNINKGWKFYLGTSNTAHTQNYDDSSWTDVDLPHDFSISQNFTSSGEAESGFLPGGTGWYRKTFVMPEESAGKTILLNFDGVYMNATVYINGEELGTHNYGYTRFAFDVTDKLICDGATENVIAVKAVNSGKTSRWYSGSGIYRDVELLVLNPVHVDLNGTTVTTPNIANGNGMVNVTAEIVNDGSAAASVTASCTNAAYVIMSEHGRCVIGRITTFRAGNVCIISAFCTGGSLAAMSYLIVSGRRNFFVRGIVTSGAFNVCFPTYLGTRGGLAAMSYLIVSES